VSLDEANIASRESMRDFDIAVLFPPECIECLPEGYNASVRLRIVFGQSMQKNN
jgi:hypothetical protein